MLLTVAYSVVLIGLGKMGNEYARAIAAHPELEVAGVVSTSDTKARVFAEKYGIPGAYRNLSDAYNATKAHAAIISVPPRVVSELLMEAWTYPWKCLTEKPAGCSLAESLNLVTEQRKAKQRPSVALNRRFYSHVQEIRSQLKLAPENKFIVAKDQYSIEKGPDDREAQLFEKAIHVVDLFSYLVSDFWVGVSSRVFRVGKTGRLVSSKIEFSQGSQVEYSSALNIPGRWSISIYSESANWSLEPLEAGRITDFEAPMPREMPISEMDALFKPGIFAMLHELVSELKGLESTLPSLEDSHKSMSLLAEVFAPLRLSS